MGANKKIWDDYRTTWKEFARQSDELQRLIETADQKRIEPASALVEKARSAHNEARDRLAEHLTVPRDEQRVRNTARLLWEFAGKPQGTAEDDWLRAECLVRSAGAGR